MCIIVIGTRVQLVSESAYYSHRRRGDMVRQTPDMPLLSRSVIIDIAVHRACLYNFSSVTKGP